jgi:hypothetical protein
LLRRSTSFDSESAALARIGAAMAMLKKPQAQSTGLFASVKAQSVAPRESMQRMSFSATSLDYQTHELKEELCHGPLRKVHEIGGRGCKTLKHPGQKIPLLDHASVKYRRDYADKGNADFKENCELARIFEAGQPVATPNVDYGGGTTNGMTYKKLSAKDMRRAKPDPVFSSTEPNKKEKTLVKTSFYTHKFPDPSGKLACANGQSWLPRHNLDIESRKLDYWISTSKREYRGSGIQKPTKEERREALDFLLSELKRKSTIPICEEP